MAQWNIRHGPHWMLQWSWGGWVSFGIHIDFRRRPTYGPYVDLHLLWFILSLGRCPHYTDPEESLLTCSRGGIPHGQ